MEVEKYMDMKGKAIGSLGESGIDGRVTRRELLKVGGMTAVVGAMALGKQVEGEPAAKPLKGNIKHSVSRWCYGRIPLEKLAEHCVRIGIKSIELIPPKDWAVLKKYGLVCAMTPSHGITKGLNRKENHEACLRKIRESIEATAKAGFPNVICFSGNRRGMSDEEGLKNCTDGVKQIIGLAERKGVTLCMELLNSKRSHKDYMCDHTSWGVELCKRIGSPRFKLLYDIYHMQIMEGDISITIRNNIEHIGHFHTGGVPGRNEIDDTQELNYTTIMRAIVSAKFDGYVGQEFVPRRKPAIKSLEQAIHICDV